MNDSEQWKSEGKCSICRRRNYCSKGCKANDRRNDRAIANAVNQTEIGKMINQFNNIMRG